MINRSRKKILSIIAAALAGILIGGIAVTGLTATAETADTPAPETNVTVVTSPFTAAVAAVTGSVVGVNNYQTVRYNRNFGYGYGFGFGYGYGGRGDDGATSQEVLAATGSGVVVAEHYVLTNHHVVEDATSLKVCVYGDNASSEDNATEYDAVLVAQDSNVDIAILYCPSLNVQPVTLGDSDSLHVGDWAICIGNPLKFYNTVTVGIVSALDRSVSSSTTDRFGLRTTTSNTMIQVDAAINSGNSGGGMFSVTGELMGVPTLKYSGSAYSGATIDGIGMCIPINACKDLISQAVGQTRELPEAPTTSSSTNSSDLTGKPRLGVTITSASYYAYAYIVQGMLPNGAMVVETEANGPAAKSGIQAGDIIVEIDGKTVTSTSDLQGVISAHKEGDTLSVTVYRAEGLLDSLNSGVMLENIKGEYKTMDVTLAVVDLVAQ